MRTNRDSGPSRSAVSTATLRSHADYKPAYLFGLEARARWGDRPMTRSPPSSHAVGTTPRRVRPYLGRGGAGGQGRLDCNAAS
jgi:hypothetical protein